MRKQTRLISNVVWWTLVACSIVVLTTVPTGHGGFSSFLIGTSMIIIAFTIPFWLLKLGFHVAHSKNRRQREFEVEDLPKDADVIKKSVNPRVH